MRLHYRQYALCSLEADIEYNFVRLAVHWRTGNVNCQAMDRSEAEQIRRLGLQLTPRYGI